MHVANVPLMEGKHVNTMRLLQAGQVPPSLWGYIQHIPCTVLFPHLKLHFNKQRAVRG